MPTRGLTSLIAAVALAASPALAQTPMAADAHPSFAVAAIRPHDPNLQSGGMGFNGERIAIRNQSLARLIMFTYAINPRQIVNAPDWVNNIPYDIDGTTDIPGSPNLQQHQEMLQKLFADRFQLKFHREQRELPVYAIRIAKGGPKLQPATPDEHLDEDTRGSDTDHTVIFTSAAMNNLVLGMQFYLDRPAVDQTGLTGRYDFSIHFANDEAHAIDPNAPPGIFTAVQEQLGLKFEPAKAMVDVYVIDHVEQPSAN
jgi:uncharacterized protein (TIGR03435 family)